MLIQALIAAVMAAGIVWAFQRYALRRGILDHPNARSSHERPTARGGGIGILLPVVAFVVTRAGTHPARWVMAGALLLVGIVGWIDDHRTISFKPRLLVHILTGVAVGWVARDIGAGLGAPVAGELVFVWWVFWTVSAINVTNFMDGIDAIIGLQIVVFAAFSAWSLTGNPFGLSLAGVSLGASVGFLIFNWPPARVFLGDVGSGVAGLLFVLLGALTAADRQWTVAHAFLPLLPLFADELITMARRVRRGESLITPHRSHVYQRLVQAYPGHGKVALGYAGAAALCGLWAVFAPLWDLTFIAGFLVLFVAVIATLLVARRAAERRVAAIGKTKGGAFEAASGSRT